ncbi:MAG: tRNA sulfurtransferase [Halobacteriales archaeon]
MRVPPSADAVLVRYGDIGTKSERVQRTMERQLRANLGVALAAAGIDADVGGERTRPIVTVAPGEVEAATTTVARTIGVVSASPVRRVESRLEPILEALAATAVAVYDGGTFAVRARRADKAFPFTSTDVERRGGDAVFEAVSGFEPAVDLDDPDVTLHVEARADEAYVFADVVAGPGGLPVGTQAPLVALVSGGIDSPVAAHRAMRRGSPVVPVYLDLGPFGGPDHQARALEAIAEVQSRAGTATQPTYVVPGGDAVERLVETVDRGRMLAWRRFMFRVADRVAAATDAVGIVTGEALGQKSSQTATNLYATSRVADRPIHRPLFSLDKAEITALADALGTYRSAQVDAGCPALVPERVATRMSPEELDRLEPDDVDGLVEAAFEAAEVLEPEQLATYRSPPSPA